MLRLFSSYDAWQDAVRSTGCMIDCPLPPEGGATRFNFLNPPVAYTISFDVDGAMPGYEIGFWDPTEERGYLADTLGEWDAFIIAGVVVTEQVDDVGRCDVCGGDCGAAHALPF